MEIDRWVVPPAVVAAVFAVVAVAPPVGAPEDGLRVEVAGEPAPGRVLLVRVAVERPRRGEGGGELVAPGALALELRDGRGVLVASAVGQRGDGVPYAFASLPVEGGGPFLLRARGGEREARTRLAEGPRAVSGGSREVEPASPVAVVVEGRVVAPEVPAVVLVRAPGAAEVGLAAEGDAVTITPPRTRADPCGVGAFTATVTGLDAPVRVETFGDVVTTTRRGLPVRAGAVYAAVAGGALEVRAALAGPVAHWMAGDARGAAWWGTARFEDAPDGPRARAPLPPGARWAVAALGPGYEDANGGWRVAPSPMEPCAVTDLSRRWFAARAPLPAYPRPRLVFDGAARSRARHADRVGRARRAAVTFLGLAVLLEVAMVLGAGLSNGPERLRSVSLPARRRLGVVLAGVALLLLTGFALLLAALVQTS